MISCLKFKLWLRKEQTPFIILSAHDTRQPAHAIPFAPCFSRIVLAFSEHQLGNWTECDYSFLVSHPCMKIKTLLSVASPAPHATKVDLNAIFARIALPSKSAFDWRRTSCESINNAFGVASRSQCELYFSVRDERETVGDCSLRAT